MLTAISISANILQDKGSTSQYQRRHVLLPGEASGHHEQHHSLWTQCHLLFALATFRCALGQLLAAITVTFLLLTKYLTEAT